MKYIPKYLSLPGSSGSGTTAAQRNAYTGVCFADDFGAVGDDITDDTVALQSAFDFASFYSKKLLGKGGTYKVTDTLKTLFRNGYRIEGAGARSCTIKQYTANKPVITFGSRIQGTNASPGATFTATNPYTGATYTATNSGNSVGWGISGLTLTYASAQPSTNTAAQHLTFEGPYTDAGSGWVQLSDGFVEDMIFNNGYYGMLSDSTKGWLPWGSRFERLQFGTMSGGFIDFRGTGVAGPNNYFGIIYGRGDYCTQPLFRIKGYATVISNYEVNWNGHSNGGLGGPSELYLMAGSDVSVTAFKTENLTKLTGQNCISMETNSRLSIDQFTLGGSGEISIAGSVYAINAYGGGQIKGLTVNRMNIANPLTGGGTLYCFNGSAGTGKIHVTGQLDLGSNVKLTNVGSNTVADSVYVDQYNNGLSSLDKGDADYTFTLGDPSKVLWKTALTADRSLNLPTDNYLNPGNLEITVRRESTATGTGNLLIKDNGVTVASLPNPGSTAVLGWSRGSNGAAAGGGFRVLSITKPATPTLTTAQVLALTAAQSADYNEVLVSDCLTFAGTSPTPAYWDGITWKQTANNLPVIPATGATQAQMLAWFRAGAAQGLTGRGSAAKIESYINGQGFSALAANGVGSAGITGSGPNNDYIQLFTGSTSTGAVTMRTAWNPSATTSQALYMGLDIWLDNLSTVSEEYSLRLLLGQLNSNAQATNEMGLIYDRINVTGASSGLDRWVAYHRASSVNTVGGNTSVAPSTTIATPNRAELFVFGANLYCFIDGVQVGTALAVSINTTMPIACLVKSAGTTSRGVNIRNLSIGYVR